MSGLLKWKALYGVVAICLISITTFKALASSEALNLDVLHDQVQKLKFSPVQIEFSAFWQQILHHDVDLSQSQISQLSAEIALLKKGELTNDVCQEIVLEELAFYLLMAKERKELLSKTSLEEIYNGSISDLPNGQLWYKHLLKSWLLDDVELNTLETIAKQELATVKKAREALITSKLPSNEHMYHQSNKSGIKVAFRKREVRINRQIRQVLGTDFVANKVNIVESKLPKSFPAPGIYNPSTETFLYHLNTQQFPEKQMDWLYLHEAVPGHHFQSQFVITHGKCSSTVLSKSSTTFSEGWGAYVETLGEDLGVFLDKSSKSYALDWQALRAVRVLLDIGIHYYGWTDQQARDVWMQYIPEQRAIIEREISRIRRWPVQVITYVYGKSKILNAIDKLIERHGSTGARKEVLSLSNVAFVSLKYWLNHQ